MLPRKLFISASSFVQTFLRSNTSIWAKNGKRREVGSDSRRLPFFAHIEVFDLKNVFTKDEAEMKSFPGSISNLVYNVCIIN